jgi:hypothetical protein
MRVFLFAIAYFIPHLVLSQIVNVEMNGVPVRLKSYTEIDGSPYLFPEWSTAMIATTNGGMKENVSYRFNIYENELEVVNEAGNNIYLDKRFLEFVVLSRPSSTNWDTTKDGLVPSLMFKQGFEIVKGVDPNDLVNVLAEGERYSLVRTFDADLVTPPKNSYAPTAGQMFVFKEAFYLIDSKQKVSFVKPKTSTILKLIDPEDADYAKELVKAQNLDLSREDHLVTFFQKLNER